MISLAGFEIGRREFRLIGRIRKVLRLEAEGGAAAVNLAALSVHGAVEEVPGVELHPGLRGQDLHHAAGFRFRDARRERQAVAGAVEHKVVIVALPEFDLLVVRIDTRPDLRRLAEVERGALDLPQFGHFLIGAALMDWKSSKAWPQAVHWYS